MGTQGFVPVKVPGSNTETSTLPTSSSARIGSWLPGQLNFDAQLVSSGAVSVSLPLIWPFVDEKVCPLLAGNVAVCFFASLGQFPPLFSQAQSATYVVVDTTHKFPLPTPLMAKVTVISPAVGFVVSVSTEQVTVVFLACAQTFPAINTSAASSAVSTTVTVRL
jgi:hypothetical protein